MQTKMKTKKIISVLVMLITVVTFSSCDDMFDDPVEGDRNVITLTRDVSSYDEIISEGDFDVYITMGETTDLVIEAEENLIPFIVTKVRDNKLIIAEKNGYRLENNRPMKIHVTTPYLNEVEQIGSGDIICDSLSGDNLKLELIGSGRIEFLKLAVDDIEAEISGSGDIYLSGGGRISDFEVSGQGNIKAVNFLHEKSESKIVGDGNIYVNAINYLKATIVGPGDIYYEGNPEIDEHIAGSGDVRRY